MKKHPMEYFREHRKLFELKDILIEWGYSEQQAKKYAWDAIFNRYLPDAEEDTTSTVFLPAQSEQKVSS